MAGFCAVAARAGALERVGAELRLEAELRLDERDDELRVEDELRRTGVDMLLQDVNYWLHLRTWALARIQNRVNRL